MRITLQQVRVAEPCHEDWGQMTGDERSRFCGQCQRHVHDVTGMSDAALADLVCQNAGRLCVRYQADASGTPISLEYAGAQTIGRRGWRRFIPVAILSLLAAGMASFSVHRKPTPIMVMGFMVTPTQSPGTCESDVPLNVR